MIKGSILIYGTNGKKVQLELTKLLQSYYPKTESFADNPDILFVNPLENKKSIGINQIRDLIKFVSEKPYNSKFKTVVFNTADKLTEDSQNALLKTLEEPPENTNIILIVKTEESLLSTIVSRCQKLKAEVENSAAGEWAKSFVITKILEMSDGERFSTAYEISKLDKDKVISLLEDWVYSLRQVKQEGKVETIAAQAKILGVKRDLEETNLNTRLALEALLLNLI